MPPKPPSGRAPDSTFLTRGQPKQRYTQLTLGHEAKAKRFPNPKSGTPRHAWAHQLATWVSFLTLTPAR